MTRLRSVPLIGWTVAASPGSSGSDDWPQAERARLATAPSKTTARLVPNPWRLLRARRRIGLVVTELREQPWREQRVRRGHDQERDQGRGHEPAEHDTGEPVRQLVAGRVTEHEERQHGERHGERAEQR